MNMTEQPDLTSTIQNRGSPPPPGAYGEVLVRHGSTDNRKDKT